MGAIGRLIAGAALRGPAGLAALAALAALALLGAGAEPAAAAPRPLRLSAAPRPLRLSAAPRPLRLSAAPRPLRLAAAPALPGGARRLGPLAGGTPLRATIALAPRDPAALAAYAGAVSTPGSPDFHRYLTVAEFAQRFAPSGATVAALRASLRSHSVISGPLGANGLSLPVRGGAQALGGAFSTTFERVALRDGRVAYANVRAPALDPRVQGVIGLDDLAGPTPQGPRPPSPRPPGDRARAGAAAGAAGGFGAAAAAAGGFGAAAAAAGCTSTVNAWTPSQIAQAYGFGGLYAGGDQGAGQTVAVYELEVAGGPDIAHFQSCVGSSGTVAFQPVDGGGSPGDGRETVLDVENIVGLAPQANVIVYQGPNTGQGPYDTYATIITQDRAQVISTSWGECEPALGSQATAAESTLFQEAAVQGQTIVAAAGDNGAQDCYSSTNPVTFPAVDDPASQPYVTGVGGTTLSSVSPRVETVWDVRGTSPADGAGGGGNSALWRMPPYQSANAESSATPCGAPTGSVCREVPDVSAEADPRPGYLLYLGGAWASAAGTSGAAPVWAALFALANASSACSGGPVGFANPALYRLAGGPAFNDVTTGNNDWASSNGGLFYAAVGYDQASGLGSPNATALVAGLCGQALRLPSPGPQSGLAGRAVSLQLHASDAAGQTVTYAAAGLPPGLALDPATGTISGAPSAAGSYTVHVVAIDGALTTATTSFSWTLTPATVTLAAPAAPSGRRDRATGLQLRARDDNGAPIAFTAAPLPPGLALDTTSGTIAGTPSRAGRYVIVVGASALGASPATASFTWTIAGPPRIVGAATVSRIRADTPRLRVALAAGAFAAPLQTIDIAVPHGLSLARRTAALRRGVSVSGGSGFSLKRTASGLRVTLLRAAFAVRVTIAAPALAGGRTLRRSSLGVVVGDSARVITRLTGSLRRS